MLGGPPPAPCAVDLEFSSFGPDKIQISSLAENGGDFGRKRKGKEEEKRRKEGGNSQASIGFLFL